MRLPDGLVSTLLEVAGLITVTAAAWLFAPLAGLAMAGVLLVLLGFVLGSRTDL
ncbi:hypothetical protein [Mycolicibacterium sp.]|jgi:hypothetical protein|uniref:hypothetical protein n=1 Tax=Mycolicibacterium sp. TaxID=2320850 RepID=UPI0025F05714|nr:hypothetical protein [Mycolicibacterium sp.]